MTPEACFNEEAEHDLAEVWSYVARNGSAQAADRLAEQIHRASRRLAEMPHMGRERVFANPSLAGMRSWVVESYVIFYVPSENGIEIIRVLHGARDIESIFGP